MVNINSILSHINVLTLCRNASLVPADDVHLCMKRSTL